MTRMPSNRARRGFTLLEIVIAVAIMAILTGIAMPVASKAFESKAKAATRRELVELVEAIELYLQDTLAFPATLEDLLVNPSVGGWTGPYLPYTSTDPLSGDSDWTVDAWARDYSLVLAGDVVTLASGGPDGSVGTSDDIEFAVDATPVRRAHTKGQLAIVNQAISLYNASHLPDTPLPTSYPMLLDELVDEGYLPATTGFEIDAWGDAFVLDPPSATPVVAVTSSNLGAG